jgi:hypothetical protein
MQEELESMTIPTSRDADLEPPPVTEGLGRLDQDRALSLADEGGMSAAGVESQELPGAPSFGAAGRGLLILGLAALALWSLQRAFGHGSQPRP